MKFSLSATIPVVQYGNLQPTLEVEAETFEEAFVEIMPRMKYIWDKYAEPGRDLKERDTSTRKRVQAFVGGEIWYDDATHTYTNDAGEVYLSGSQYAAQFEKPFNSQAISAKMAAKYGVDAADIVGMWELKAAISRAFGTSIHEALELYGKYGKLAAALDKTTHLHDHPVIKKAVESFYEAHTAPAEYEVLIVDHTNKRAGRIDRLELNWDMKTFRVQDYKTNADITKHLPSYWKQLEFYGSIMEAHGWVAQGYDIFHWDGEWHTYSKEIKEETA